MGREKGPLEWREGWPWHGLGYEVSDGTESCLADRRWLGRAGNRHEGMRDGKQRCLDWCGVYERDQVPRTTTELSVWEGLIGVPGLWVWWGGTYYLHSKDRKSGPMKRRGGATGPPYFQQEDPAVTMKLSSASTLWIMVTCHRTTCLGSEMGTLEEYSQNWTDLRTWLQGLRPLPLSFCL